MTLQSARHKTLIFCFCAAIVSFALYHFSDNDADPDLWGHVLFGQRMILLGGVEKHEPFSWTAAGHPWVNHETLAEVALGASHFAAGGTGILLLKLILGMLTFVVALRTGARGMDWPARAVAWALAPLAVIEIAWGFAARPQIFTGIALAALLWILKRIHSGSVRWAAALPVLFVVWINTHGGALAGICILGFTAGATTAQWLVGSRFPHEGSRDLTPRLVGVLWLATLLSSLGLLLNPWGFRLPQWLVESVQYVRPEIEEWNAPALGWDHLPAFILAALVVASLFVARKQARWWEAGVMIVIGAAAMRHARHLPLFGIVALALLPPYLLVLALKLRNHTERLLAILAHQAILRAAAALCILFAIIFIGATLTLRKDRFYTMEISRHEYPVAAIEFIQQKRLAGNVLPFFDWGEMALWELGDSRVSFDGRLDTCYPREVIDAHWNFFYGRPWNESALDLGQADIALLPIVLPAVQYLKSQTDWTAVYADPLAVVFVRDAARYEAFAVKPALVVMPAAQSTDGRVAFPAEQSGWLRRTE